MHIALNIKPPLSPPCGSSTRKTTHEQISKKRETTHERTKKKKRRRSIEPTKPKTSLRADEKPVFEPTRNQSSSRRDQKPIFECWTVDEEDRSERRKNDQLRLMKNGDEDARLMESNDERRRRTKNGRRSEWLRRGERSDLFFGLGFSEGGAVVKWGSEGGVKYRVWFIRSWRSERVWVYMWGA